jgi:hypothetical protein
MQSGGHQIWGWLECAQDRQCYVVVTSLHKSLKISLLYWLVGHQFAQITPMWPFLSTSSSCMVGSSQEWFVTYKAFSCLVRNATGRTAAYIYRLTFHKYSVELDRSGYWILDLWHLYLHFTHQLVSQEVAWYFQAASLCILHHFVAPMWAQSHKCTMLT